MMQRELENRGNSLRKAEEELKKLLLDAEENASLGHGKKRKKKNGRMDSPHYVAQGNFVLQSVLALLWFL